MVKFCLFDLRNNIADFIRHQLILYYLMDDQNVLFGIQIHEVLSLNGMNVKFDLNFLYLIKILVKNF